MLSNSQECQGPTVLYPIVKLIASLAKTNINISCSAPGDTWSDIATTVMEELVSGVILFAVVVSYTEDYVPLVNLYRRDQDHVSVMLLQGLRAVGNTNKCAVVYYLWKADKQFF